MYIYNSYIEYIEIIMIVYVYDIYIIFGLKNRIFNPKFFSDSDHIFKYNNCI